MGSTHRSRGARESRRKLGDPDIDRIQCFQLQRQGAYRLAATADAPASFKVPGFRGLTLDLDEIFES